MTNSNNSIEELVRDITKVHPMAKSEVRRRLSEYIHQQNKEAQIFQLKYLKGIPRNEVLAAIDNMLAELTKEAVKISEALMDVNSTDTRRQR